MKTKFHKFSESFLSLALIIGIFLSLGKPSFAQPTNNWTKKEIKEYNTIQGFCNYLSHTQSNELNQDSIFQSYIYFDYALKDSDTDRKNKRLSQFNELLLKTKWYIDSVGIGNLDAQPIRFYKSDSAFFEPFNKELKGSAGNTFGYYNKSNPQKPLGYILFDEKSAKLISWILIDQGGTHYFLTFDML